MLSSYLTELHQNSQDRNLPQYPKMHHCSKLSLIFYLNPCILPLTLQCRHNPSPHTVARRYSFPLWSQQISPRSVNASQSVVNVLKACVTRMSRNVSGFKSKCLYSTSLFKGVQTYWNLFFLSIMLTFHIILFILKILESRIWKIFESHRILSHL